MKMPDKRTTIIIARDIYKSSSYYRAVKAKEVIAFDLFVVNVSADCPFFQADHLRLGGGR